LGKIKLDCPIVSAPMDTVTGAEMAIALCEAGGLGIIHRYNTPEEQADMVNKAILAGATNIGAAIGATGDYLERAKLLVHVGANVLCVDVAHGDHVAVKSALRHLRAAFGSDVHIMAGNVATLEGFNHSGLWGADSVRVGVGGGATCSTRIQTGHGMPTFSSVLECSFSNLNTTIVADGGLRNSGDIVKSLAAGAGVVMLGSVLAGSTETPGNIVVEDGVKYKAYRGMASKEAQTDWKGSYSSFEGVSHRVRFKGNVADIIDDLKRNIRSGLSYSGVRSIKELQCKATFIRQTAAGQTESSPHIYGHR
jgi:IMP dehydrogenase